MPTTEKVVFNTTSNDGRNSLFVAEAVTFSDSNGDHTIINVGENPQVIADTIILNPPKGDANGSVKVQYENMEMAAHCVFEQDVYEDVKEFMMDNEDQTTVEEKTLDDEIGEYIEESIASFILSVEDHESIVDQLDEIECEYELLPFNSIAVDIREHKRPELEAIDGVKSIEAETVFRGDHLR